MSKVTLFNTGSGVVLGSLERVGTQATELLIAVHRSLGTAEKEVEDTLIVPFAGAYLKSVQSARRLMILRLWPSGIGAPIVDHCRFCGLDRRDLL